MWYKYPQNRENLNIHIPNILRQILFEINNNGGVGYLVGGIVRDALFNKIHGTNISPKDYDIEVFSLSLDRLISTLEKYGLVNQVGKSFGVIKLSAEGDEYDFSLPRKDSKTGPKHQDFSVSVNEKMSEKEALARRDLTINSMLYNPLTEQLIDPFGGKKDIENKVLRHTSDAFSEDPLRVLRLMSMAGRFGFHIAPETIALAREIKNEYNSIPIERVEQEFKKLVLKGVAPGIALDVLRQTEWDDNFPEIKPLHFTDQEPEYHPEGGVATHTAHVMNEAARIATENNLTPEEREVLVYAALCHDFAKPATTKTIVKKGIPRITSHGHEEAGGPMARHFLESIGVNKKIIDQVVPLVENHLNHVHMSHMSNPDSFIRQLAERLHPSNIKMLEHLIEADHSGRPPLEKMLPEEAKAMSERAKSHNVYTEKHPDLLQGRDLMPYTDGKGGPIIGQILKEHRNDILKNKLTTRSEALSWLENRMKSQASLINGNDVMNILGYAGPKIKETLDKAWIAQKNGEFTDKDSALEWLRSNKD
jgi:tRNA nucleotidyltransferase (CCA-adding enzyme)